ncbi:glycine betaine ABC transporter substrate-binding protein [Alloalcanivorax sp. C16-2]|uniref:glycine betaine ABC transporter substrate-binding protein n=1 Tax=Alloalcanivorax TaxID=3020832 RepID=UPI001931E47F|nr:glycine betaine ABC transporter substrate-binding protein [Alloalcanivorax marinus]MBL7251532.1 glycine betaine ABC transporter substrate-binding protein [Alloalcanivorax marinus]
MPPSMPRFVKLLVLALVLALSTGMARAADKTLTFGWTAWSDAEFVTKLAKRVIEEHYDYDVKLQLSSIGVQYQGVANGDLDAMLMAWLPSTHENYWNKVSDKVVDLGPLYEGARLGWAVPDYIPKAELSSIEDLKKPEVKAKLRGSIQGIDPGAGLMQLSEKAIDDYGLDYHLRSASGAAMTAALTRAMRDKEWVVVTAWTPHWMFGHWNLRFLDDPKGSLGEAEHIDVLVRRGFKEDHPEVAGFLTRMRLPLDELQEAMDEAQETSYEEAIDHYLADHQDRINEWLGQ